MPERPLCFCDNPIDVLRPVTGGDDDADIHRESKMIVQVRQTNGFEVLVARLVELTPNNSDLQMWMLI